MDLERGEGFSFLGLDFRDLSSLRGVMRPHYAPKLKKRPALNFPERPRQAGMPRRRLRDHFLVGADSMALAAIDVTTWRSWR